MANDDESEIIDEALQKKLDQGWHALEDGDAAAARAVSRQALADSPEAPEAWLLEAACLRDDDERDQAIAALRRAMELDAEWCTPVLWLAELLATEPAGAAEALTEAAHALDLADEEDEYLNALVLKAGLEADLGKIDQAKETLEDLPPPDVAIEDPTLALEIAELCLAVADPAGARDRLLTLTAAEPELADAWYALGIAAEALDDDAGLRVAWKRTAELDAAAELPEAGGDGDADARLSESEVGAIAAQALDELPEKARQLLANVPIIIDELPAVADVEGGLDPRVLGLFSGTPHPESSNLGGQPGLTQIVLFRRNLERAAPNEEALRDEIRTTLLHETGHFFGMDEEALERVGLD
jgi:predicted Zn-dependent protease with MMP-like domain